MLCLCYNRKGGVMPIKYFSWWNFLARSLLMAYIFLSCKNNKEARLFSHSCDLYFFSNIYHLGYLLNQAPLHGALCYKPKGHRKREVELPWSLLQHQLWGLHMWGSSALDFQMSETESKIGGKRSHWKEQHTLKNKGWGKHKVPNRLENMLSA